MTRCRDRPTGAGVADRPRPLHSHRRPRRGDDPLRRAQGIRLTTRRRKRPVESTDTLSPPTACRSACRWRWPSRSPSGWACRTIVADALPAGRSQRTRRRRSPRSGPPRARRATRSNGPDRPSADGRGAPAGARGAAVRPNVMTWSGRPRRGRAGNAELRGDRDAAIAGREIRRWRSTRRSARGGAAHACPPWRTGTDAHRSAQPRTAAGRSPGAGARAGGPDRRAEQGGGGRFQTGGLRHHRRRRPEPAVGEDARSRARRRSRPSV